MAETWITKASKKLCCPILKVFIARPTVYTSHNPECFSLSLMTADINFSYIHRYWITNESFTKYIFDHLHILFSKRYRLTASDRISSLIPIQIPSKIRPVSRIHNPLVFVFHLAKHLFLCYRIVEVSHCAKHLLRIYRSIA